MPEILKERSELDPQFQWDLTPMFENDAAWETALDSLDADIESLAAFAGKLTDAVTIGAYLDASTEVGRKVERLYCYASQRHDEDTRDDKAQSMYARIGSKFLYPGCGYGGSCFPKDVKALARTAQENGYTMQVIEAVERVNEGQKSILFGKLQRALGDLHGKTIAIWGLAFKPETDDMREAPALVVIDLLSKAGATVRVYDPVAMEEGRRRIGDEGVHYAGSMYEAAKGADAIALVTEWKQFRMPDWAQLLTLMRDNILVDGRNIFDKEEVLNAGLRYYGIGK